MQFLIYRVKHWWHFFKTGLLQALPAIIHNHFPQRQLKLIAITGTDGKTTSATLLYHVLKTAGFRVGLVTTVSAYIGDQQVPTGFHVTTPQPKQLYRFLAQARDKGIDYMVLEITSHGHYQFRDFGLRFKLAGLTNISHEHLDYHLNLAEYARVKLAILQSAQQVVLNEMDSYFNLFKKSLGRKVIATYSSRSYLPLEVKQAMEQRFPEKFNRLNARLVYELARLLSVETDLIAQGFKTFPVVPGRMELITNRRQLHVYIDFAHTPNGLKASLSALKQIMRQKGDSQRRLIAVFGAASKRDLTKRPLMGKIATQLADLVVLTAEDPRYENVWSIIRQIKSGVTSGHDKIASIADRRKAIYFAINRLAEKGDYIVILGKGHEKSINYGGREYPWSDRQVAEEALAQY